MILEYNYIRAEGIDLSNMTDVLNKEKNEDVLIDHSKSVIVVADTHFGLNKEDQYCDPEAFSDFVDWVKGLDEGETLTLGYWHEEKNEIILVSPETIIFLGDIIELWDASPNSIDVSTRSIIQKIYGLKCEKIYILGNHDYDLVDVKGKYPLGDSSLKIIDEAYSFMKGDKRYVFLHGHQFDSHRDLPWQTMPIIRNAALAFGGYSWIFVVLFFVTSIFELFNKSRGLIDYILLILVGSLSLPFLIIYFGRGWWNELRSQRYEPDQDKNPKFKDWWKTFPHRKEYASQKCHIVYGHTHLIDYIEEEENQIIMTEENNIITLLNIPSWIIDSTRKSENTTESVFRESFLYITEEGYRFIGWDKVRKKPFFIPQKIIGLMRDKVPLIQIEFEMPELEENLQKIGWPKKTIEKWINYMSKNQ